MASPHGGASILAPPLYPTTLASPLSGSSTDMAELTASPVTMVTNPNPRDMVLDKPAYAIVRGPGEVPPQARHSGLGGGHDPSHQLIKALGNARDFMVASSDEDREREDSLATESWPQGRRLYTFCNRNRN